jgi:hypothetical protein
MYRLVACLFVALLHLAADVCSAIAEEDSPLTFENSAAVIVITGDKVSLQWKSRSADTALFPPGWHFAIGASFRLHGAFNSDGETALVYAAREGKVTLVASLLSLGVDADEQVHADQRSISDDTTALMTAAIAGDREMIGVLVAAGASLNLKNSQGRSALMLAVRGKKRLAAKVLLKAGAAADFADEFGDTELGISVTKGYRLQAADLLAFGANPMQEYSGSEQVLKSLVGSNLVQVAVYLDDTTMARVLEARSAVLVTTFLHQLDTMVNFGVHISDDPASAVGAAVSSLGGLVPVVPVPAVLAEAFESTIQPLCTELLSLSTDFVGSLGGGFLFADDDDTEHKSTGRTDRKDRAGTRGRGATATAVNWAPFTTKLRKPNVLVLTGAPQPGQQTVLASFFFLALCLLLYADCTIRRRPFGFTVLKAELLGLGILNLYVVSSKLRQWYCTHTVLIL